jgi:hypothetical protein
MVLDQDPKTFDVTMLMDPPPPDWIDEMHIGKKGYGHRYGAMMMIMPREAIERLGCFDERFVGWGGEDVAILRAIDTLYGKHKTIDGPIYHLSHPKIGQKYNERKWENQDKALQNSNLALRYHRATGKPSEMQALVDEGCDYRDKHPYVNYEISRFPNEE